MKGVLSALLVLCVTYNAVALPIADSTAIKQGGHHFSAPVCYIGFGLGTNNPSGIIGFDFSVVLDPQVTLDGGAGTSTWGNKLYVGAKYYLKTPQRGWGFGGGLTFNSGNENVKMRAHTVNGVREVTLVFKPQTNIYVAATHYWTIGRKYNRFFMELGYSVPVSTPQYDQLYGPALSSRGNRIIKILEPGGIVAALGFSFALYNRQHGGY